VFAIEVDDGALVWREVEDPTPAEGEVLIDVAATSVNRADLLQRRGFYPPPPGASPILGLEAAGTIAHDAGPFAAGAPVMALLAGGGYAERVAVPAGHVLPIPAAVGLPAAGGVMEVFLTAYLNLVELGGLEKGQRILIHGGAGGVGTAAIQLAKALGAEVWTTASADTLPACRRLGATRALDYRTEDFAAAAKEAGGVDLILDCLGAKYLAGNLKALRTDGTLVVIGLQGGVRAELDLGKLLAKRIRLQGSTLRSLPTERKSFLIQRFRERVWPLLDDGTLEVVVHQVLPIQEAEAAHSALGGHVGKLLLSVRT
jgi:putative PIG3 family NAD(P)H quinone oxidoreductase